MGFSILVYGALVDGMVKPCGHWKDLKNLETSYQVVQDLSNQQ